MSARLQGCVDATVRAIDREKDRTLANVTDTHRIEETERAARLAKRRIQALGVIDLGVVWESLLDLTDVPITREVVAATIVEPFAALLATTASAITDLAGHDSRIASLTAELAKLQGRAAKQANLELADILNAETALLETRLRTITAARGHIDPLRTRVSELCRQCAVTAASARDDAARVALQESRLAASRRSDLRKRWSEDLRELQQRGETIATSASGLARTLAGIQETVDEIARRALLDEARCTDLARGFRLVAEYFRSGADREPADAPPIADLARRTAPLAAAAEEREWTAQTYRSEVDAWLGAIHEDAETSATPEPTEEHAVLGGAPTGAPTTPRPTTPQDLLLVAIVLLQELGDTPTDHANGRAMATLVEAAIACGFITSDDEPAFRNAVMREAANPIRRIVGYEASPARRGEPATFTYRLTSSGAAAAHAYRRLMTSERRTVVERMRQESAKKHE